MHAKAAETEVEMRNKVAALKPEGCLPALVDDRESTCSSSHGGRTSPEHCRAGLNSKATPFVPQAFVMQQRQHHEQHQQEQSRQPTTPILVASREPLHQSDYHTAHTASAQSTPMQSPISPASFAYPHPPLSNGSVPVHPQTNSLPQTAYTPILSYATSPMSPVIDMSGSLNGMANCHSHAMPYLRLDSSCNSTPSTPGSYVDTQRQSKKQTRRSRIMEEYRATSSTANWELSQLVSYVVEFTMDQEGSRLIQRKLENSSPEDLNLVYTEVLPHAIQLMQDVFGNYVIQKLLDYGTPAMRLGLINCIKGNTVMLTLQTYGCRIVQKALEVMSDEERLEVVGELDGHVSRCVQDQNGNHVIQKCIEVMFSKVDFVVESFIGRVAEFATHAYGCRCVQRILEFCKAQKEIVPILDEILTSVHSLVTDQYGNYVVQHVLINGHPHYQYAITQKLRGYYTVLSVHKFASNVVEKMFEFATPQVRISLLEELTSYTREDGMSGLVGAVMDQYGNYVMQKIFDLCNDKQKQIIVDHLRPNEAYLRRALYGKHFVTRLERQGCLTTTQPALAQQTPINAIHIPQVLHRPPQSPVTPVQQPQHSEFLQHQGLPGS